MLFVGEHSPEMMLPAIICNKVSYPDVHLISKRVLCTCIPLSGLVSNNIHNSCFPYQQITDDFEHFGVSC